MADRATDKNEDIASKPEPAKRPYAEPVLLRWGSFNDLTQTNNRSNSRDSSRSRGTN